MASTPSPPRSSCVHAAIRRLRALDFAFPPRPQTHPPTGSIPRTTTERLLAATPKEDPLTTALPILPSAAPAAAPYLATDDTVLYLAYGSNLSAQTFRGRRGIRPLSAVAVAVPTLRLTFDLPGIAYSEPCFANVAPREIPKPPKLPPGLPDLPPGYTFPPHPTTAGWSGGLIGVVYEVTPADYAAIVQTEGGGASYKDVLVPCLALPVRQPGIPERPPVLPPRPFWAHTLYAPRILTKPGDGDEGGDGAVLDDGDDGDGDHGDDEGPIDRLKAWWRKLLLSPLRADPEYAQPSERYLKLITDGAAEHDLPIEYQRWLHSLQPYTITSRLQALGQVLFLAFIAPVMLIYLAMGLVVSDENGQVPVWFGLLMETFFHFAWTAYDRGFKPVFGDGERTVEDNDGGARGWRRQGGLLRVEPGVDEEKAGLVE